MTFTKTELTLVLMSELAFSKQEARKFVSSFFDQLSQALIRGEGIKLSRIGNFKLRDKKLRPGRNPKTKESIPVSARRVVTFQPSQTLKKRIQELWMLHAQGNTMSSKTRAAAVTHSHETAVVVEESC